MMETVTIDNAALEGNEIRGLYLKIDRNFNYIPGQYIMIAFPGKEDNFHSFSIVEYDSKKKLIRIVFKRVGDFTSALFEKEVGSKLIFKGPYGKFSLPKEQPDVALIAGGVGITPIYSMLSSALLEGYKGNIYFFYSGKTLNDMPLIDDLFYMRKENWVSRFFLTDNEMPGFIHRRMGFEDIQEAIKGFRNCIYYICGPPPMMSSLKDALLKNGVPEEGIRIETFK